MAWMWQPLKLGCTSKWMFSIVAVSSIDLRKLIQMARCSRFIKWCCFRHGKRDEMVFKRPAGSLLHYLLPLLRLVPKIYSRAIFFGPPPVFFGLASGVAVVPDSWPTCQVYFAQQLDLLQTLSRSAVCNGALPEWHWVLHFSAVIFPAQSITVGTVGGIICNHPSMRCPSYIQGGSRWDIYQQCIQNAKQANYWHVSGAQVVQHKKS